MDKTTEYILEVARCSLFLFTWMMIHLRPGQAENFMLQAGFFSKLSTEKLTKDEFKEIYIRANRVYSINKTKYTATGEGGFL